MNQFKVCDSQIVKKDKHLISWFLKFSEEYSDDIKSTVTDCLQKDPEDRPTADMLLNRSCILPNFASNFGSLNKMRSLQPPRSWLGSQAKGFTI